jgi:hypothetical protein
MAEDFFLKRKKTPSIEIDDYSDYNNEDIESDMHSCGLKTDDSSTFSQRNESFFDSIKSNMSSAGKERNPVEIVSSSLEKHYSAREIAFLLSKNILSSMIEESKKGKNNN